MWTRHRKSHEMKVGGYNECLISDIRFNLIYLWQQRINLARNYILRLASLTFCERRRKE